MRFLCLLLFVLQQERLSIPTFHLGSNLSCLVARHLQGDICFFGPRILRHSSRTGSQVSLLFLKQLSAHFSERIFLHRPSINSFSTAVMLFKQQWSQISILLKKSFLKSPDVNSYNWKLWCMYEVLIKGHRLNMVACKYPHLVLCRLCSRFPRFLPHGFPDSS